VMLLAAVAAYALAHALGRATTARTVSRVAT
jgi:hypothetical protein